MGSFPDIETGFRSSQERNRKEKEVKRQCLVLKSEMNDPTGDGVHWVARGTV